MAPIPEPMPTDTAMRPSAGDRLQIRASSDPKPALIWAVGPSRPPDPPEPMVSGRGDELHQHRPGSGCHAGSRARRGWRRRCRGPRPLGRSGRRGSPDSNPPRATTRGRAQGRTNPEDPMPPPSATGLGALKAASRWRKRRVASFSASKKATAARPAITPISAAQQHPLAQVGGGGDSACPALVRRARMRATERA